MHVGFSKVIMAPLRRQKNDDGLVGGCGANQDFSRFSADFKVLELSVYPTHTYPPAGISLELRGGK